MSIVPDIGNSGDDVELTVWDDDEPAVPVGGSQLRVLTLNCWGLWIVAKQRQKRIRNIAKYLKGTSADLVMLQEVFVSNDADALIAAAGRGHLKHSQRFRGGVLGGELLTLSRYPIVTAHFEPYRVSGNAAAVWHGDFFAGKGIGHTRIDTPAGLVDAYNTHTHASYSHKYKAQKAGQPWREPADVDAPARLAQISQLAAYISLTAGHHVVVGGDLNAPSDTLDIELFRTLLPGLRDAWGELHPDEPGYTSNSPDNSLSKKSGDPQMRLDYIWTTDQPLACSLFTKKGTDGTSFSDHMGVAAVLGLRSSEQPSALLLGSKSHASGRRGAISTTLDIIRQGRRRYSMLKDACLALSAAHVAIGLACFGFIVAQPWWNFPGAVLVVLAIVEAIALVLAPLIFVTGIAGFGSVGHALVQAASELQLQLTTDAARARV